MMMMMMMVDDVQPGTKVWQLTLDDRSCTTVTVAASWENCRLTEQLIAC